MWAGETRYRHGLGAARREAEEAHRQAESAARLRTVPLVHNSCPSPKLSATQMQSGPAVSLEMCRRRAEQPEPLCDIASVKSLVQVVPGVEARARRVVCGVIFHDLCEITHELHPRLIGDEGNKTPVDANWHSNLT